MLWTAVRLQMLRLMLCFFFVVVGFNPLVGTSRAQSLNDYKTEFSERLATLSKGVQRVVGASNLVQIASALSLPTACGEGVTLDNDSTSLDQTALHAERHKHLEDLIRCRASLLRALAARRALDLPPDGITLVGVTEAFDTTLSRIVPSVDSLAAELEAAKDGLDALLGAAARLYPNECTLSSDHIEKSSSARDRAKGAIAADDSFAARAALAETAARAALAHAIAASCGDERIDPLALGLDEISDETAKIVAEKSVNEMIRSACDKIADHPHWADLCLFDGTPSLEREYAIHAALIGHNVSAVQVKAR